MEKQISPDSSSAHALDLVLRRFEEAKARNSNFSLRGFAKKLGISSGALSEILKGKRPLTNSIKRRIAPPLLLSPQETVLFFQDDLPEKMGIKPDERMTLTQDQFHLISDWWYFGLLNLIKTNGFRNQAKWMATRLGLSIQVVTEAWERLFRLGYLEKEGAKIRRKQPNLKTTDNLKDLSVKKSHLGDLALIEKSLLEVPLELRDNLSSTFVVDKKDLPKAKEMIRMFQQQFLNQFGKEQGEEVYKITISLFPLTKISGDH